MGDDLLTTEKLLLSEFEILWPNEAKPQSEQEYRASVNRLGQSALCLSGGGIRSASFSLGVIQALAQKGILGRFQYLSTVSGGGYIGSWMQRWIHEKEGDLDSICKQLAGDPNKPAPALPEIEALREHSNYLTPKTSLTSIDFWAAIVIAIRNILLNWLIFLPALLALAATPNLYFAIIETAGRCISFPPPSDYTVSAFELIIKSCPADAAILPLLLATMLGCAGWATFRGYHSLPSSNEAKARLSGKQIFRTVGIPSIIYAGSLPIILHLNMSPRTLFWLLFIAVGIVVFLGLTIAGFKTQSLYVGFKNILLWLIVSSFTAVTAAGMAYFVARHREGYTAYALAVIGPLLAMWTLTLQAAFYVGFRKQLFRADADREWLARLSALRVVPVQSWLLIAFACLIIPITYSWLVHHHFKGWETITAFITALSGMIAVIGGKSALVSVEPIASAKSTKVRVPIRLLISLATAIFIAALLAFLAFGEKRLAESIAQRWSGLDRYEFDRLTIVHIAIILSLIALARYFCRRINVNRFSLHGVYRNRLTRAFLGAARAGGRPASRDPFTGFDPDDNVRLHQLIGHPVKRALYPIINVTMNLSRGDNLAWQERMASSFVLSPIGCGSDELSLPDHPDKNGAYVRSNVYGGSEPEVGNQETGLSLGTAMTISGAAASPSQGYNSTPATAFLMTLFNVRLGAWLANPARARPADYNRDSPSDAFRPLLNEMFGQTNDRDRDVYLSDGGHFENLGLYEMVRRRCRFILVIDAGADEDCLFEDLGNAVRKVSLDLNVDIAFSKIEISSRAAASKAASWAVGRIRYPEFDEDSWLLYLKPSYFKASAPLDVRAYAEANSVFPHEPTFDQWFSESQFESYRRLGYFLASKIGSKQSYNSVSDFFDEVINEQNASNTPEKALL